jgi:putative addiction module killer protein
LEPAGVKFDAKAAPGALRVNRMAAGNFGDCKPLREGVQELKIDVGPGYRVFERLETKG